MYKMTELNKKMKTAVESYTSKNKLVIKEVNVAKEYYTAVLEDNKLNIHSIFVNILGSGKIYMKAYINNKQKRIPKSEW